MDIAEHGITSQPRNTSLPLLPQSGMKKEKTSPAFLQYCRGLGPFLSIELPDGGAAVGSRRPKRISPHIKHGQRRSDSSKRLHGVCNKLSTRGNGTKPIREVWRGAPAASNVATLVILFFYRGDGETSKHLALEGRPSAKDVDNPLEQRPLF